MENEVIDSDHTITSMMIQQAEDAGACTANCISVENCEDCRDCVYQRSFAYINESFLKYFWDIFGAILA